MAKKFPLYPMRPERTYWGCDEYCSTGALSCGSSSGHTQHPVELLGNDWYKFRGWGIGADTPQKPDTPA